MSSFVCHQWEVVAVIREVGQEAMVKSLERVAWEGFKGLMVFSQMSRLLTDTEQLWGSSVWHNNNTNREVMLTGAATVTAWTSP